MAAAFKFVDNLDLSGNMFPTEGNVPLGIHQVGANHFLVHRTSIHLGISRAIEIVFPIYPCTHPSSRPTPSCRVGTSVRGDDARIPSEIKDLAPLPSAPFPT
ncbi:hypothetical protein [Bradyrhizobium sp. CCBAU 65884]|uniref:hypothetical protein n=1 Tax=Bradyrhizobium sp. CCBAU 65884 TaxID=722477 RepID=UPI002305CF4B|nr:hypothetical protein [Bradyrhizobium sp. CCBAU 65884]